MDIWVTTYAGNGGAYESIGAYESKEDAMEYFDATVRALGYDPETVSEEDIAIAEYDRDDDMGYARLYEDESYLKDWSQITVQPCTITPSTKKKKVEE